MLRGIVLGKLTLSIIVSIIVSYVCFINGNAAKGLSEAIRWYGLGGFFVLLTIAFSASMFLLHYRKSPRTK